MKSNSYNKTIEQKVIKFIKDYKLIESGDRILVALSGGSDSVFLLNFLNKYKKKYKIELAAFHLNHLLRKEAKSDQKLSEELCKKLNVPFHTTNKNVKHFAKKNKMSVEEAGRVLRYDLMKKIAVKYSYNKIATAHNLNDNSETVLLNLIKGKGLKAIAGIPIKQENIIRPIICLTKNEIENYLKQNEIEFVEDLSNLDETYERNYLRHKIVPQITEGINKNFYNTVFQTSRILSDYLEFTEKVIEAKYKEFVKTVIDGIEIDITNFNKESQFLKSEIIRRIILQELKLEPKFKKIEEIFSLINKQRGRKIKISNSYEVFREKDKIKFIRIVHSKPISIKLKVGREIFLNNKIIKLTKTQKVEFTNNHKIEFVNADKIVGDLFIQSWREGDKFVPLGSKGSKKISDFLTDTKVPSSKRKEILLIKDSEKIICVLGYRIDDRVKITNETKNIYKIEISNVE